MFSRILFIFLAFSISVVCSSRALGPSAVHQLTEVYIVYTDHAVYNNDCNQYLQLLKKLVRDRLAEDVLRYCYNELDGFAARLTYEEAEKLRSERGILSVNENEIYRIDDPVNYYQSRH